MAKKPSTTSDAPFSTSRTSNYVARNGGLPPYIRKIARGIRKKRPGYPLGRCIALAITTVRRWAAGAGGVSPKVRAKAAAAVAEYNALLARTKAARLAKKA